MRNSKKTGLLGSLGLKAIACLSSFVTLSSVLDADIIQYDMSGAAGNQSSQATSFADANVVGLAMVRGAGLTGTAAANSFNSSGWSLSDPTDYVSFGFTVNSGFVANLSNITFDSRSSNTGPGQLAIRSSLDNFASVLHTFAQTGTANTSVSYDASVLGPVAGTVEFRVFANSNLSANGGALASGGTFRIGNTSPLLTVGGTVSAVPEPASILLLGVAGVGGFAFRRFRRKNAGCEALAS